MMDDTMQALIGPDLDVARALERYAHVRLSPSPAAAARMRARVMREARLMAAARSDAAAVKVAVIASTRVGRSAARRRSAGLLLAATLSLGLAAGAMAAAQPGGPLFAARLWFEGASLPADAAGRANAEMARLESRMSEALTAAARGDEKAVGAALLAYRQIADETLAAATGDLALLDRIRIAIARHLAVLQGVQAKVPPQAQAAIGLVIQRAIDHGNAVIDRLEAKPPPAPATTPKGGGQVQRTEKATPKATVATPPRPRPTRGVDRPPAPTPAAAQKPKAPPEKAPKGPAARAAESPQP